MVKFKNTLPTVVMASLIGAASALTMNQSISKPLGSLSEQAVVEIFKQEIINNPQFVIDAIQNHMDSQQAAEMQKQDDRVIHLKDRLQDNADWPFIGNPDGKIELVYFFDVNCIYCKKIEPVLTRIVGENDDIRILHREIPILAETSRLAAVYSGILWELFPEKYVEFHELLMAHEGLLSGAVIEASLVKILGPSNAIDVISAGSNSDSDLSRASNALIDENLELAREAGITGTPFVFIGTSNGVIRGAGGDVYDRIVAFVEEARAKE